MCGIAGFIDTDRSHGAERSRTHAAAMAVTLQHRGPDDGGVWVNDGAGVALAHRRLSILDLSPEGHQPMLSACGRYVIVFNGEIYNHGELRKRLERKDALTPTLSRRERGGNSWRGHSDTEVMLAAIGHWGLEAALREFVGMFAFALWDRAERVLHLARDRVGEKPLYYGWVRNLFLFASELKALQVHPAWEGEINRGALALFLRHNYVPAPHSIYTRIYKLLPGCVLSIGADSAGRCPWEADRPAWPPFNSDGIVYRQYWSANDIAESGVRNRFPDKQTDAIETLDTLLKQSVRGQMVADVPVGAFLSGGIDSSVVVAAMQSVSDRPVRTFTIGFHEREFNEAEAARAVARHLGTDHTELYVRSEEALAVIPGLPAVYDEPFADSSQVPTYLICKLAREHVTVALSGDGGDELFGGYNRYFLGRRLWRACGWLPAGLRRIAPKLLMSLSPSTWSRAIGFTGRVLPLSLQVQQADDKVRKLAEVLGVASAEELYHGLVSHWKDPAAIVFDSAEPATLLTERKRWATLHDFTERMMYLDLMTYLPDDILVKVDRAGMAVSLETRMPMLDHRLIDFAWRVPLSMKVRGGRGKWLLRQVLNRYVPPALTDRPKMGFGIPLDSWLRGPLRDWAESLLAEERLRREGFLDPTPIRHKWAEHLSGARNWQYHLWDILTFEAWLESSRADGNHAIH